MRLRPLFAAVASSFALGGLAYGCSGGPATEDMCAWLQNPNGTNCVAEFHEDIKDKCGGLTPAVVTGSFGMRAMLDICVLTTKGGSVAVDPPIDLTKNFPPDKPTTFKIINPDGTDCGSIIYTNQFSFSFNVAAPPAAMGTGGGSSSASSGTGIGGAEESDESHYTKGMIQIASDGAAADVTCPAPDQPATPTTIVGDESHHFNLNQVLSSSDQSGCPSYSQIVPQAILELVPGGVNVPGSLRLKIQYPPEALPAASTSAGAGGSSSTSTGGALPQVPPETIYYIDCAIPGALPACANGIKDGSETDVDCGGPETSPGCPARCGDGQQCTKAAGDCDCDGATNCAVDKTGLLKCTTPDGGVNPKGTCTGIICENMKKDGTESDVDCGGGCTPCDIGKICNADADCKSLTCINKLCAMASCTDMLKNGDETDVDCGGSCMTKCADGKGCMGNSDCQVNGCYMNKCSACGDGMQDNKETDVDCGGGTCALCTSGQVCGVAGDCVSNLCINNKCAACTDMVLNGSETDVDCGGANCNKCPDGKMCLGNGDCQFNVCVIPMGMTVGKCDTCTDGGKDGSETDVDCGGTCPKCAMGLNCKVNGDCANGACLGGKCN